MPKVKVVKSDQPETKEILAEAIVKISKAADELCASGLNRDAIVILLQAKTKLPRYDINLVLDSLKQLQSWYCRD